MTLCVSEWDQSIKGWRDHYATKGQWVIRNDLTGKIKILDHEDYRTQFEVISDD